MTFNIEILRYISFGIAGGLLLWLWVFLFILYKTRRRNIKLPKKHNKKLSKTQKLTYIVIFLWIIYGILALWQNMSLEQLAGYYASLTLFISTYLWGEYRRSSRSTDLFSPGKNSSRETIIYVVLCLWCILGALGIFILDELNSLTVYFGALSPFVMSYIIYKTTKGFEHIPEFEEVKMSDNLSVPYTKPNTNDDYIEDYRERYDEDYDINYDDVEV